MKNLLRLRVIVLALLLLVTVGVLGSILWLAFNHSSTATYFANAKAAWSKGNYAVVRQELAKVINHDHENEEAYQMLADLAERERHFQDAAGYWSILTNLNSQQEKFKTRLYLALAACRNDAAIISILQPMVAKDDINIEQKLILANAYLRSNHPLEAEMLADAILKSDKSNLAARLLKADILFATGKTAAAEVAYKQLTPTGISAEIRCLAGLGLCRCRLVSGDVAGAAKLLAKLDPVPACELEIRNLQGMIFVRRQQYAQAAGEYEKILQVQTANLTLAAELAEIYASDNNREKLQQLRNRFKDNSRPSMIIGYYIDALLAGMKNDFIKAYDCLKLCPELQMRIPAQELLLKGAVLKNDLATAASAVLQLLNYRADPPAVAAVVADFTPLVPRLIEAKRDDQAVKAAELLLSIAPRQVDAARIIMRSAFVKADYLNVLRMSRQILAIEADDQEAAQKGALALLELKRAEEGCAWCEKWLAQHPNSPVMLMMLARGQRQLNELAAAVSSYKKALTLSHYSPGIAEEAGLFMLYSGYQSEIGQLIKTLRQNPDHIRQSLSWALTAAEEQLNHRSATAAFQKAIELNPTQPGLYLVLTDLYVADKNVTAAVECLKGGLRQMSEQPELQLRLAVILRTRGTVEDDREASEIFLSLLRREQYSLECLVQLSELAAKQGKKAEALKWVEKASALMPANPGVCFCYGNRLMENHDYVNAINQYRIALDKNYRTKECQAKMIAALREQARQELAADALVNSYNHWREILSLLPNDPEARRAIDQLDARQAKETSKKP